MDIRNYRPVTVLTAIAKVFEQLLSTQVTSFIESYLCKTMTAYRKNHSCETTLLGQVERWKQNLDEKKLVGFLSTDMSKAFDSLRSQLLIAKLRAYGFSDEALGLMRSYFCERKCRVKIALETTSEWYETSRGCPQASSFGPLLWNVFQNDLHYTVKNCSLFMYSDDHQLSHAAESIKEVEQVLNEEGNKVSHW